MLFDAMYLCPPVVRAVWSRGWHDIGAAKFNRRFTVDGRVHHLDKYGPNVARRSGRWVTVSGLVRRQEHCVAARIGYVKKLGQAKPVLRRLERLMAA